VICPSRYAGCLLTIICIFAGVFSCSTRSPLTESASYLDGVSSSASSIDPSIDSTDIPKILDLITVTKERLRAERDPAIVFFPARDSGVLSEIVRLNEPRAISAEIVDGKNGVAVFFHSGEQIAVLRMTREVDGYQVFDVVLMMP